METVKIIIVRDDVLTLNTRELSAQLSLEFGQVTSEYWKKLTLPDAKTDLHILGPDISHDKVIPAVRAIRMKNEAVPIIAVRPEENIPFKLSLFDAGLDDYLRTPYHIEELIRRIKVFLKRTKRLETDTPTAFKIADLYFDYKNLLTKFGNGPPSRLTQRQANLLRFFCEHQDTLLERGVVLYHVWGKDDYFLGRSMDVIVTQLRKILAASPFLWLETIHGIGFIFHTKK